MTLLFEGLSNETFSQMTATCELTTPTQALNRGYLHAVDDVVLFDVL